MKCGGVTMGESILREVFDANLNCIIRLKQLENGRTIFTVVCKGEMKENLKGLENPIFAHIRVTDKCNLNCPYCYTKDQENTLDMNDDLLNRVIDMCNTYGIINITWTGGEPFLRPNMCDVIKRTHSYGIRQTILTNGTLTNCLIDAHIPITNINFQISLNNIWNDFSGNEIVIRNASYLVENGYDVLMTVLLEPVEIEKYENLVKKLIENHIPMVRFGIEIPIGGLKGKQLLDYQLQIKKMEKSLNELRQRYQDKIIILYQTDKKKFYFTGFPRRFLICEAGTTELYIDNNGDVYPCPLLNSYKRFYCGNVFKDSWEKLWNALPMQEMRNIPECNNCSYNCLVWCRALKFAMDEKLDGKSYFCLKKN